MERESVRGEVATAKTLARMLSATPPSASGPVTFAILDIHALQEQFYFGDTVHIRLKSCVSLLHDRLLTLPEPVTSLRIVFPDEGAAKRFRNKLDAFGEPVGSKRREGAGGRRVVISDGDPAGRHCIIVDDLVQTGGTLLECAKALRAAGAASVSAYVTHAVFPAGSWRRFAWEEDAQARQQPREGLKGSPTAPPGQQQQQPAQPPREDCFRYFFITDTIPTTAAQLDGVRPFEVLSIAPVIEDVLGV
jgi:phosphoribosylpyrophosphate synthetase